MRNPHHHLRGLLSALVFAHPAIGAAQSTIHVGNQSELQRAVISANEFGGNTTIVLGKGVYTLSDTLRITAPYVTLAGSPAARGDTIVQGDGMSDSAHIGVLVRVAGAHFELRDLTLQRSRYHLIQIAGESKADAPLIHNCILRDSYQQMIKVSISRAHREASSDGGLVENCVFEYTAGIGPQYYIGGIDAHGSKRWTVRGNIFRSIASPSLAIAEFAVHFWDGSADDIVERNLIVNCDRGIGFGLDSGPNHGGIIRNNMIYHASGSGLFADAGIALTNSPGTQVYNNTVFFDNDYPRAIEYRFPQTTGVLIANNLVNRAIAARNGASGIVVHNVTSARADWFVDAGGGDLHLASARPEVLGAGEQIAGLVDDIDGRRRTGGTNPDIGAQSFGTRER